MKSLLLSFALFSMAFPLSAQVAQKCISVDMISNSGANFWNRQDGKNEFGMRRYRQVAQFDSAWNEKVWDLNTGQIFEREQTYSEDLQTGYYFLAWLNTTRENDRYLTNAQFSYPGEIIVGSFAADIIDAWIEEFAVDGLQVNILFNVDDAIKAVLFKQAENKDKGIGEFFIATVGKKTMYSLGSIFSVNTLVRQVNGYIEFGPFYVISYDQQGAQYLINISRQSPFIVAQTYLDAQKAYMILGPSGQEAMLQEIMNDGQERWFYIPYPMACREKEFDN